MKKLLLFTNLFLAFACSKDDEGETFLDKYDGTSWIVQEQEELDGAGVEIFIFSNGTYLLSQVVTKGGFSWSY